MTKGVVIGKFYPPHKGHKYLIDTATSNSDELTVIVAERSEEFIPGKLRAKWIQEIHPRVRVLRLNWEGLPPNDSKLWAKLTIDRLGFRPDIAFTSETYGETWCEQMRCKHFLVDTDRVKVPISGTKIRENPLFSWEFLEPPVRAYFAKRVCVLGAESTGTTTLAIDLAKHYKTTWVPEFGRFYSDGKLYGENNWNSEEFEFIAKKQNEIEDKLARDCNKILICDTDSFATSIWQERYLGKVSRSVESLANNRKYDLYIVTDIDIPFVQDGTRDGEKIRTWMHKRFLEKLEKKGRRYIVVSGSRAKRLKRAVLEIDKSVLVTQKP